MQLNRPQNITLENAYHVFWYYWYLHFTSYKQAIIELSNHMLQIVQPFYAPIT